MTLTAVDTRLKLPDLSKVPAVDEVGGEHKPGLDVAFDGLIGKEEIHARLIAVPFRPGCVMDLHEQIGTGREFHPGAGGKEARSGA